MFLNKPKYNTNGWYILCKDSNDYLHVDGKIRHSTYDSENGKYAGYHPTELAAYKAIYNYYTENVVDEAIITSI